MHIISSQHWVASKLKAVFLRLSTLVPKQLHAFLYRDHSLVLSDAGA